MTSGERPTRRRMTARGEATRARMISSAADLMYVRGVNAVTLDDVRAATGTSKSQLYKHFPAGKPELVRAVAGVARRTDPGARRTAPGAVEVHERSAALA